jgi:hypothetical protein
VEDSPKPKKTLPFLPVLGIYLGTLLPFVLLGLRLNGMTGAIGIVTYGPLPYGGWVALPFIAFGLIYRRRWAAVLGWFGVVLWGLCGGGGV